MSASGVAIAFECCAGVTSQEGIAMNEFGGRELEILATFGFPAHLSRRIVSLEKLRRFLEKVITTLAQSALTEVRRDLGPASEWLRASQNRHRGVFIMTITTGRPGARRDLVAAVKLAPSILSADFSRLGEDIAAAEKAGADRIHVDVMDGHFVPNLALGVPVVQSLRRITRLPLEAHLMVVGPDLFLDEFARAGCDAFLVHWEGNCNLHRTVQRIKDLGKRAGVAINPATPASVLEEILQDLEQVLVMTVNPGFGHQRFLRTTLHNIQRASRMIEGMKPGCELEVDGGIDKGTAPLAVAAGANVLVAGSSIFASGQPVGSAMQRLREAARQAARLEVIEDVA